MRIDLTGQKFNSLTVVEIAGKTKDKSTIWKCRCDCGAETTAITNELTSGHKKSCGCLKHKSNAKDLTGKRFGRLTVLKRVGTINRRAIWQCRCDCGKKTDVRSIDLLNGNTKSCGCMHNHFALYH